MQVGPFVPGQEPPVQVKDVADGLQFAESMELPPGGILMESGVAVNVQIGGVTVVPTVTVVDAILDPPGLMPVNV